MTAHINAKLEDISNIVLMSGDPKRIEYIAKNFLTDYKLVSDVRGILAYTGYYNSKRITVMAHGMGIPSIGIYSYELYNFYNVDTIIRMGTCGGYIEELNLLDTVVVDSSYSESSFGEVFNNTKEHKAYPNMDITKLLSETAKDMNINAVTGCIHTSDVFYKENNEYETLVKNEHVVGVEMESYALFVIAKELNKKSACILTVSDSFVHKNELSSEERATSTNNMIKISLETAAKL